MCIRFEAVAISWATTERCLFFEASFLALSCFMVDHLLWPDCAGRLSWKHRRLRQRGACCLQTETEMVVLLMLLMLQESGRRDCIGWVARE